MTKHCLMLLLFLNVLSPAIGIAGDSCSFTPSNVTAVVTGGGVPVGTVIIWPFSTNPEGWSEGKWLECNGQAVSASAYPELRAVVGANVPDLRGLFLRGTGGNAAALGTVQEDAGRNVTGSFARRDDAGIFGGLVNLEGAFYGTGATSWRTRCTGGVYGSMYLNFDASRVWGTAHTAAEFRPRNRATRYLIRAKN